MAFSEKHMKQSLKLKKGDPGFAWMIQEIERNQEDIEDLQVLVETLAGVVAQEKTLPKKAMAKLRKLTDKTIRKVVNG